MMPSQSSSSSRWHMPSLRSKKSAASIGPSPKVISAPLAISAPLPVNAPGSHMQMQTHMQTQPALMPNTAVTGGHSARGPRIKGLPEPPLPATPNPNRNPNPNPNMQSNPSKDLPGPPPPPPPPPTLGLSPRPGAGPAAGAGAGAGAGLGYGRAGVGPGVGQGHGHPAHGHGHGPGPAAGVAGGRPGLSGAGTGTGTGTGTGISRAATALSPAPAPAAAPPPGLTINTTLVPPLLQPQDDNLLSATSAGHHHGIFQHPPGSPQLLSAQRSTESLTSLLANYRYTREFLESQGPPSPLMGAFPSPPLPQAVPPAPSLPATTTTSTAGSSSSSTNLLSPSSPPAPSALLSPPQQGATFLSPSSSSSSLLPGTAAAPASVSPQRPVAPSNADSSPPARPAAPSDHGSPPARPAAPSAASIAPASPPAHPAASPPPASRPAPAGPSPPASSSERDPLRRALSPDVAPASIPPRSAFRPSPVAALADSHPPGSRAESGTVNDGRSFPVRSSSRSSSVRNFGKSHGKGSSVGSTTTGISVNVSISEDGNESHTRSSSSAQHQNHHHNHHHSQQDYQNQRIQHNHYNHSHKLSIQSNQSYQSNQSNRPHVATAGDQTSGYAALARSPSSSSTSRSPARPGHPGSSPSPGPGPAHGHGHGHGPVYGHARSRGPGLIPGSGLDSAGPYGRVPHLQCAPINEISPPDSVFSPASSTATHSLIFSPDSVRAASPASSATPTLVEDDARQTRAPLSKPTPPSAIGESSPAIPKRVSRHSSEFGRRDNLEQPAATPTPLGYASSAANSAGARHSPIRPAEDVAVSRDTRRESDAHDEAALASAAAAAHATRAMGNETSRFRHVRDKLGSSNAPAFPARSDSKGGTARNMTSKRPPVALRRPPTPEYHGADARGPAADVFASTLSPASSPDAPRSVATDYDAKDLPSKPRDDDGNDDRPGRYRNGSYSTNGTITPPPRPDRSRNLPGAPAQVPESQQQTRSNSVQSSFNSKPSDRPLRAPPPLRNRPVYDPAAQRLHQLEKRPFSPPQHSRQPQSFSRQDDQHQRQAQQQQQQMQQQVQQLDHKLQQQLRQQQREEQEEEERRRQEEQQQQQRREKQEEEERRRRQRRQEQEEGPCQRDEERGRGFRRADEQENASRRTSQVMPAPLQPRGRAESRSSWLESRRISAANRRASSIYSDGKPEEQHAPPGAGAFALPKQPVQDISEEGIFKAPPLRKSHFTCYQNHIKMTRRPNKNYPLTCQACGMADTEDRWVCTFCSLQMCNPCTRTLQRIPGRDLTYLVDEHGNPRASGTGSVAPSRPGTRLD